MKTSLLIHPHFLIKYYLLEDIQSVARRYSFTGSALDVGCGEKPYRALFPAVSNYEGIDGKQYSKNNLAQGGKPDYFFTSSYRKTHRLPFRSNSYEHTFSFQVAEHHPDPDTFIEELTRITKKGGTIVISVPFIWGLHEEPHDYFRYTEYTLTSLFTKNHCKILEIRRQGSIASTVIMLCMDYAIELVAKRNIISLLGMIMAPLILFLSYVCLVIDRIFPSQRIFLNYLIVAKKL